MEVVTAYKCPKTGRLFESETEYQTHQAEIDKAAKKARDVASRKAKIETLTQVPRLHARNHVEIAQLIGESLNKIRKMPGYRHIPNVISVKIQGKYQERGTEWDLLSEIEPDTHPVVTPASNLEFRGRITIISDDRPRNSDDYFSSLFHYMKKGSGGGGYDEDSAWKVAYDLLFNADDFPLIHAGLKHLEELEGKREERLLQIDQVRQEREAASKELKELDSQEEALRAQLGALRDQLGAVEEQKEALQEQILKGVRSEYPDTHEDTRQDLEHEFPKDQRLRLQ